MPDLKQQFANERETTELVRLKVQELQSRHRVHGETTSQPPSETRPLAWQDVVGIVWWTVVALGCLTLLVDWLGWERFGFVLGVLFWSVVFLVWLQPGKFAAGIRSRLRKPGSASHDTPRR